MTVTPQTIEGLYLINNFVAQDPRGAFIKTYHSKAFEVLPSALHFVETYYSVSNKNVLRGLHFQHPPHQHSKLVHVIAGKIIDVVIDLRTQSPSYHQVFSTILHPHTHSLLIPEGCAHGFLSLDHGSIVSYAVTSLYNAQADSGVLWSSIGFEWPIINPIVSERDRQFSPLAEVKTAF